jgi:hypothetical protein
MNIDLYKAPAINLGQLYGNEIFMPSGFADISITLSLFM